MVTRLIKWISPQKGSAEHVLWREPRLWKTSSQSYHTDPPSFAWNMTALRLAPKTCCEDSGQNWRQKNWESVVVGRWDLKWWYWMQSPEEECREDSRAGGVIGEDYDPQGPGASALWLAQSRRGSFIPVSAAFEIARSCRSIVSGSIW